jgi:hypothetical protein
LRIPKIPAHDPKRFETTDGLDFPLTCNGDRVIWARQVLDLFQETTCTRGDDLASISDLIGNLLHLTHSLGESPERVLQSALDHFLAEAGEIEIGSATRIPLTRTNCQLPRGT